MVRRTWPPGGGTYDPFTNRPFAVGASLTRACRELASATHPVWVREHFGHELFRIRDFHPALVLFPIAFFFAAVFIEPWGSHPPSRFLSLPAAGLFAIGAGTGVLATGECRGALHRSAPRGPRTDCLGPPRGRRRDAPRSVGRRRPALETTLRAGPSPDPGGFHRGRSSPGGRRLARR